MGSIRKNAQPVVETESRSRPLWYLPLKNVLKRLLDNVPDADEVAKKKGKGVSFEENSDESGGMNALKTDTSDQARRDRLSKLIVKNVAKRLHLQRIVSPPSASIPLESIRVGRWEFISRDVGDLILRVDAEGQYLSAEFVHMSKSYRLRYSCKHFIDYTSKTSGTSRIAVIDFCFERPPCTEICQDPLGDCKGWMATPDFTRAESLESSGFQARILRGIVPEGDLCACLRDLLSRRLL